MQRITFTLALTAVLGLSGSAHAQPVYKCSSDGKVTYSEAPCRFGKTVELQVPAPPQLAPHAKGELVRQKSESTRLESARHQREAQDQRANMAGDRAAAAYRKKCGALRLKQKWAEQDALKAAAPKIAEARLKVRRAGEMLTLECRD